ncbi:hypothetical protein B0T26DRAFT_704874 [Lasiosphaeria miniovina]|uniref:Uncharacterized protein n=1 Tax=Lasiosphaeria miniovina TaxID=1954250 RepID=A0AA40AW07_9PEZI|nr:uncharacterized protein B0T26DRAFT_704874 [Lasiosphaeria miniovina]KAK0722978.1 hypothetical protein B0T26DRAFT_704874 [Lasiosphaeria miniovina]
MICDVVKDMPFFFLRYFSMAGGPSTAHLATKAINAGEAGSRRQGFLTADGRGKVT